VRQRLGAKKVQKYAALTGLPVVAGLVRGGTDHRVDLVLPDRSIVHYWPDGTWETSDLKADEAVLDTP
jgi:hypothetical protein